MEEQANHIRELAIHYFEGNISPAEEEILFRFINARPSNRKQFRLWEKAWMQTGNSNQETASGWEQLQRRIQLRETFDQVFSKPRHHNWRMFAAAAAVACLFLVGGLYTGSKLNHVDTQATDQHFALETSYGEKSKLILADGTTVWLNAGSALRYTGNFNLKNREVYLTGEAYFEVSRQSDGTPFTVKTDAYSIVVKGTKFNVTTYPEDHDSKTTLLEGAIDILYRGKHIPVNPGEQLSLDKQNGRFSRQPVQADLYNSWTEGRLEYDKITLEELAVRLSRKYDVRIHLDDKLEKETVFRVSLRNEETVGEVIRALSAIIPIQYQRDGRDIYIRQQ